MFPTLSSQTEMVDVEAPGHPAAADDPNRFLRGMLRVHLGV